ncbi:Alpha/beta hydrolase fold-1 [Biscogniauxia sp. FL1348]|nr:Alpha/beta hydrolase fold-1 [Biscogniauxia sp. FL1348]
MSSSEKPVVLLVGGSWHLPIHYSKLIDQIKALGYECVCPKLPTIGEGRAGKTWEDDARHIQNTALPLFEAGKEVFLVAHSYGGIPACAATQGLGLSERAAKGLKGGFTQIVFLTAFALPAHITLIEALGGEWPEWIDHEELNSKSGDTSTRANEITKALIYNDVPEDEAQRVFESLLPQSQAAFEVPVTYVATDLTIPKTFVICKKDPAAGMQTEETLTALIPGMKVESIDAGHSPFLSKPEECARLLIKIAQN